jgi:hypothetical protein
MVDFSDDSLFMSLIIVDTYFGQDTVIDAGKCDGALGIVSAISALKVMHVNGKLQNLRRPVEVSQVVDKCAPRKSGKRMTPLFLIEVILFVSSNLYR